jgi:hypothetical protein
MGRNIEDGWLVQVRDESKEYLVISLGDEERNQIFGYERERVCCFLADYCKAPRGCTNAVVAQKVVLGAGN